MLWFVLPVTKTIFDIGDETDEGDADGVENQTGGSHGHIDALRTQSGDGLRAAVDLVQGHVKTVLFKYAELFGNEQIDVLTAAAL